LFAISFLPSINHLSTLPISYFLPFAIDWSARSLDVLGTFRLKSNGFHTMMIPQHVATQEEKG